jgi:hypothetical protein
VLAQAQVSHGGWHPGFTGTAPRQETSLISTLVELIVRQLNQA